MWGVGGGGGNHGLGQAYFFFREKGWAKREFHDDWGWVIDGERIDGAPVLSDYIHASVSHCASTAV